MLAREVSMRGEEHDGRGQVGGRRWAPRWRWIEGEVATAQAHFELWWPGGRAQTYREASAIARVGRAPGHPDVFVVQWLDAPRLAPHHLAEARADVRVQLQFYLVDKDEPDPWRYARHHCGTAANAYACVTWSYVEAAGIAEAEAPAAAEARAARAAGDPDALSIPVTCPRCEAPTVLDSSRHFACPRCAWHD
jgi:hypothetical protein